jgi:hypothetical protein
MIVFLSMVYPRPASAPVVTSEELGLIGRTLILQGCIHGILETGIAGLHAYHGTTGYYFPGAVLASTALDCTGAFIPNKGLHWAACLANIGVASYNSIGHDIPGEYHGGSPLDYVGSRVKAAGVPSATIGCLVSFTSH